MPFTLTVPDNYSNVVLIALGVIPVLAWAQGTLVGVVRKSANVPYPHPYASMEQSKSNQDAHKFNCAQRAHGNLLENMSQTMAFMLFGGLFYPNAVTALGVGWLVFRLLFAYGYIYSEKPNGKGRLVGSGFWLMQAGLWGCSIAGALKLM